MWRLLTYAFLHDPVTTGIPMHILFNMLFFWFMGEDVERIYGFRNFIWLYAFTSVVSRR